MARREGLAGSSGSASGAPSCSTSLLRKRAAWLHGIAVAPVGRAPPRAARRGGRNSSRRTSSSDGVPSGGGGRCCAAASADSRRRLVRVAEAGGEERPTRVSARSSPGRGRAARGVARSSTPAPGTAQTRPPSAPPSPPPAAPSARSPVARRVGRRRGGGGRAASRSNAPSTWRRRRIAGTLNDGAGSAARSDCHAAAPEPPPAAAWRSGDANAPLGAKRGDNGTDATSAMLSATATRSSAFGCHAGAAASRRSSRSRLGRICRPVPRAASPPSPSAGGPTRAPQRAATT